MNKILINNYIPPPFPLAPANAPPFFTVTGNGKPVPTVGGVFGFDSSFFSTAGLEQCQNKL